MLCSGQKHLELWWVVSIHVEGLKTSDLNPLHGSVWGFREVPAPSAGGLEGSCTQIDLNPRGQGLVV